MTIGTNIRAIIPVKPLSVAKTRLASAFDASQRQTIAEHMLHHVLYTLEQCPFLDSTIVVTSDCSGASIAREYGAEQILDSDYPGLNHALNKARRSTAIGSSDRIIILPSDLPAIRPCDLIGFVRHAKCDNDVVIAPDRFGSGTNALLLPAGSRFVTCFGPRSYKAHINGAPLAGHTLSIFHNDRIGLDIDTPEDVAEFLKLQEAVGTATLSAKLRSSCILAEARSSCETAL